MEKKKYKLVTLLERKDLLLKSVDLLNQEWPRSQAARLHSQERSLRSTPPMSFLYVHIDSGELIGHARVCNLPNRRDAIWIESVIISRSERGKGLGKALMFDVEEFCRELGMKQAFLSTEDKMEFYKACGYENCDPIVHSTATTSVFSVFESLEPETTPKGKPQVELTLCVGPSSAPPPPPPPPVVKKSISTQTNGISTIEHQYMFKNIA